MKLEHGSPEAVTSGSGRPGAETALGPFHGQDLRWAGLVAVLLAVSPATGSSRVWLSTLLGLGGGGIVLGLRTWRRRREGPPATRAAAVARPELPVFLALGAVAFALAPVLAWLFHEYTISVWRNVHGVFVPLFMLLLARSALRRDPEPTRPEASAWGFPLLASGLALAVLDAGVRSHHLAALGLLLCLPGLSLLFLGGRRTRLLAAPLALGVFLLPVPQGMEDPIGLTAGTSVLAEPIIDALGVPVLRHGTIFVTRNGFFVVSQNCSGLSALHAALALSGLLAVTARGWGRRIALPLIAYPITLFFNVLRCAIFVVVTDHWGLGFLETALHGLSGLVVLWAVLAVLWLCADHTGLRESLS